MNRQKKWLLMISCIVVLSIMIMGCSDKAQPTIGTNTDEINTEATPIDEVVEVIEEVVVEEPKFVSPYTFEYPDAVRGIYVTSHSAGGARFNELVELLDTTDLNSMVIDIKDDHGYITYPLEDSSPLFKYSKKNIGDIHKLMKTLEEHQIYPIARIVVFKDSVAAQEKPDWSFIDNGNVWVNGRKESFINPFMKETWEHNVEIAKMAAELGFKEIQFDYVRFPEGFETRDESLQYSLGEYAGKKPTKLIELEEDYKVDIVAYQKQLEDLQKQYSEAQSKLEQYKSEVAETQTAQANVSESNEKVTAQQQMVDGLQKEIDKLTKNKPVFPEYTSKETAVQLRVDAITDFVEYAKQELAYYDVDVSVDIFGYTATIAEAPGYPLPQQL